jgi:predicted alpha/beta hydrolase family esterase
MTQVVVIHGGETFDSEEEYLAWLSAATVDLANVRQRRWKDALAGDLGEEYDVLLLKMPNPSDAKYAEWKIWFEKYLPLLDEKLMLVGHSLGGIFLAKYLSEETIGKDVLATFLIAAPYDDSDAEYSLADFTLPRSLAKLSEQSRIVRFYHSTDDPVVRFSDLAKYQSALPYALTSVFGDRAHFNQAQFPELVSDIVAIA